MSGFNFLNPAAHFREPRFTRQRFANKRNLKRQFFIPDYSAGEHIYGSIRVHTHRVTEIIELLFDVGVHANAERGRIWHIIPSLFLTYCDTIGIRSQCERDSDQGKRIKPKKVA
jgi:hypothetical protein